MSLAFLLPLFLTLHLIALIVMAGTTLIDFISYRTFWKLFDRERERSIGLQQLMGKFSRLAGIGAAILVLTGIAMMAVTHGAFGEQLWFRIKFVLVLLLLANSLLIGRRQGTQLKRLLRSDSLTTSDPPGLTDASDLTTPPGLTNASSLTPQINRIKRNLQRFHITQFVIFFVIILLSVFKFN